MSEGIPAFHPAALECGDCGHLGVGEGEAEEGRGRIIGGGRLGDGGFVEQLLVIER